MPIFANHTSRIICQGTLDEAELFHMHQSMMYGPQLVAWVKTGFGGKEQLGLPVFDSVREAKWQTSANMSLIFVQPHLAGDAIIEAIEGGIETIVCFTSGIPFHDMVVVQQMVQKYRNCRLIGPGSCGLITPSQCKAGVMPAYVFTQGSVGMISCTDTLGYEVAWQITNNGFGQSTFVGIGAEPLAGTSIVDVLKEFERDGQTEAVVMVLQGGVSGIEAVVEWVEKKNRKPILAVIAGHRVEALTTTEQTYGISEILKRAGVIVVDNITSISSSVKPYVTNKELL